jgi:phosphoglycerol transferase MdoB-like AlkP superfamily enzyme
VIKRRVSWYLFGLYLAYVLELFVFSSLPDRSHIGHDFARLATPLVELGIAYITISWLLASHPAAGVWWRRGSFVTGLVLAFSVALVYSAQIVSLDMSDNFITVLALENGGEGRLVRGTRLYALLAVGFAWWSLFAWLSIRQRTSRDIARASLKREDVWLLVLLLALAPVVARTQAGNGRLEVHYRQAPIASLLRNVVEVQKAKSFFQSGRDPQAALELSKLAADAYPFERRTIYSSPLPFSAKDGAPVRPNVIVIFSEGLSARLIGAYGGTHPGLTPNIDRFAQKGMRVDNYFNHTAATYRALQGQLDSGYPEAGGKGEVVSWEGPEGNDKLVRTRYQTVPLLLRQAGYRSYFFSPHADTVTLNTMIRAIGFDTVFNYESAVKMSPRYGENLIFGSLNDVSLFDEMVDFLKSNEGGAKKRPMFVGAYNIGTHAFMDGIDGAEPYGDGSNKVLNRVHDFDQAFGRFLTYFLASPFSKNTILVFTSDHASFPEPAYREVMVEPFKAYFVDRIPLIIYDPVHVLPAEYDASGRTSLDFAPTLMQLLGVKTANNSFLGDTLFEPGESTFGFSAIGNDFFMSNKTGVYAEAEVPAIYKTEFERRKAAVMLYYRLSREDRIFNAAP